MDRREIEEAADRIIKGYDEVYFEVMNRILSIVRGETNILHETTPKDLGQTALQALEVPKIP